MYSTEKSNAAEQKLMGRMLLVGLFLNYVGYNAIMPFFALFETSKGLSASGIGTVLSLSWIVSVVTIYWYGRSKLSREHNVLMVVVTLFGLAWVKLILLWTGSYAPIITFVVLNAWFAGIFLVAWQAEYTLSINAGKLVRGVSLQQICIALSNAAGNLVGGILIQEHGFRALIMAMTVVMTLGAVATLPALRTQRKLTDAERQKGPKHPFQNFLEVEAAIREVETQGGELSVVNAFWDRLYAANHRGLITDAQLAVVLDRNIADLRLRRAAYEARAASNTLALQGM
jgi:hypothetical protein